MDKRITRQLKDRGGLTLVEMIATFALIGLFMVAATFMVTNAVQASVRTGDISSAITVSELILDKVAGEITAAQVPHKGQDGWYFWVEQDTSPKWAAFCGKDGEPISIYAFEDGELDSGLGDGQLYVWYYGDYGSKPSGQTLWSFDESAYMGYKIANLTFSIDDYEYSVVKIDLTLEHQTTHYTYQTSRYAQIYSLDPETGYLRQRSDGRSGVPAHSDEFKIGEDDIVEVVRSSFSVYFRDWETNKLLGEKAYQYRAGDIFMVYADYIPAYKVRGASSAKIDSGSGDTNYTFYYDP